MNVLYSDPKRKERGVGPFEVCPSRILSFTTPLTRLLLEHLQILKRHKKNRTNKSEAEALQILNVVLPQETVDRVILLPRFRKMTLVLQQFYLSTKTCGILCSILLSFYFDFLMWIDQLSVATRNWCAGYGLHCYYYYFDFI